MSTKFMMAYHAAMHNLSSFMRRNERKRQGKFPKGACDVEAREILVAQQAQLEALYRGIAVLAEAVGVNSDEETALSEALSITEPRYNSEPDDDDDDVEPEVEALTNEIVAGKQSEQGMLSDWILTGANILHSIRKEFVNGKIKFSTSDSDTSNQLRVFLTRTGLRWESHWGSYEPQGGAEFVISVKIDDARACHAEHTDRHKLSQMAGHVLAAANAGPKTSFHVTDELAVVYEPSTGSLRDNLCGWLDAFSIEFNRNADDEDFTVIVSGDALRKAYGKLNSEDSKDGEPDNDADVLAFVRNLVDGSDYSRDEWEWPLEFAIHVVAPTDTTHRCLRVTTPSACNRTVLARTFRQVMHLDRDDIIMIPKGFITKRRSVRMLEIMSAKIRVQDDQVRNFHFSQGEIYND